METNSKTPVEQARHAWQQLVLLTAGPNGHRGDFFIDPMQYIRTIDDLIERHEIYPPDFGVSSEEFVVVTRPIRLDWVASNLSALRGGDYDIYSLQQIVIHVDRADATFEDANTRWAEISAFAPKCGQKYFRDKADRINKVIAAGKTALAIADLQEMASIHRMLIDMGVSADATGYKPAYVASAVSAITALQNKTLVRVA